MIDGLKPYPAYKDSGVPWLGEVPEHWEIERLKSSVVNVIEQTAERENGDLYVALEHVESWTGRLWSAGLDVTFDSQVKRFCPGDVLFGKLRPYLAKVTRPACDGVCVGEFFVLRSRSSSLFGRYLEYLLRSKPVIDAINSSTFGAKMPRADWQFVGNLRLSFPPLPEQTAIVRFLDHADRRIRRYIRAKQKLIKLLEEQKQAIIHRAVTRGLDPNVRLKPSGVEWLGDVPEHWKVMPLRRLTVSRCDGPFGSGLKTSHYADQGIRVVRLQNIGHAEFKDSDVAFIPLSYYATLGDHTVEPGDLLIAGLGDERHPAGRACVAPSFIVPAMVKADCFRFRLFRQRLDPEFAALHLTATAADASSLLSTGATRQRTNLQATASRSVAIPPTQEQLAIVKHITDETSSLGRAIRDADREIALLREYCTRLIADVVTGKLDVREVGARLPDEADEPETRQDTDTVTEGDNDTDEGDLDDAPEEAEA